MMAFWLNKENSSVTLPLRKQRRPLTCSQHQIIKQDNQLELQTFFGIKDDFLGYANHPGSQGV